MDKPGRDSAVALLVQILDRYGSLEAFSAQLHRELDEPTEQLPRLDTPVPTWLDPPWWPIGASSFDDEGRHAWRGSESR
ncbi:hypothetical protein D7D52_32445 [Nocardia yunnanensis]|uniref:Uncharacterized protein n=1 Tax=Nocardia yunnanensis TaxID=2382165 RepID=A0A386ZMD9_9NOCA|nr:hypothetical protein [Nocardia yunnanensis]AYF77745.1 hypothetical protein D7D52_32445 [Nocardia yunnanensis]